MNAERFIIFTRWQSRGRIEGDARRWWNTDERLTRTPTEQEFMLMTTLPGIPLPPSSPEYDPERQKIGEFAIAARMLLDGLRESRAQLDTAIQLLAHLSRQPPPHVSESYVEAAAKVRRVLAEIRRASAQSKGDR